MLKLGSIDPEKLYRATLKLLKATRKGKKSKEGFVVTPADRNRHRPHRRPRTIKLTAQILAPRTESWLPTSEIKIHFGLYKDQVCAQY